MKVIGENEVRIQLKASTGPMGPAGPKGDKGDKGDTGPRGLTGATGATGPQGEKGDAFTYGDFTAEQLEALRGPQGEKGDTGATGPQGPQGEKGDKGDKGDPGATGPQGEVGPQGPAGSIDNLPIASATQLGGVKPVAKTGEMTQSVGVDGAGGLWAMAGGSGDWITLADITLEEDVAQIDIDVGATQGTTSFVQIMYSLVGASSVEENGQITIGHVIPGKVWGYKFVNAKAGHVPKSGETFEFGTVAYMRQCTKFDGMTTYEYWRGVYRLPGTAVATLEFSGWGSLARYIRILSSTLLGAGSRIKCRMLKIG